MAGTASAAAAGAAGQAQASPAVTECGTGAPQTRPSTMILTCADDGELAEHLVWSSWTVSQAAATGTVTWRDCASSCVDGKQWDSTSADITLTDPVNEPGHGVLFTRLNLNVTGPTPAGFQRTLAFSEAPVPAPPAPSPAPTTSPSARPAAAPSGSLGYAAIEGYWIIAGGPDGGAGSYTQAQVAAAITGAESSFLPGIIQPGVDYCGGGADRAGWGLWQITCGNSVPQFGTDFQVLDPWNNAEAAVHDCVQDEDAGFNCFTPWSTWASGAYARLLAHTAPDKDITDPGEYVQINATPPGTPSSPKADPGSKYGPPMPGSGPTAAFTTSMSFVLQEQPLVFDASDSKAGPGSSIKSYSWKFGDGASASGESVSHAFVTSAPVTVTLSVTDANGLHSSVSHSYSVLPSDSAAGNYVEGGKTQEHLFYETSTGALDQTWWVTSWANQALAGSPVTDPVTLNYGTEQNVFYTAGGKLEVDAWAGSSWVQLTLPGAVAPGSALGGSNYAYSSGNIQQNVFFTGGNGSLQQTYWNGSGWVNQTLPGKPVAGSPIVSSLYLSGSTLQQHVFFIGAGDTLQQTWYGGKSWVNQTLPGTPEIGQNTLATSDYVNNGHLQQHVFWTGAGGTLWDSWYGGTSWADQELPGSAGRMLGTNDYLGGTLQQHVFFATASGALDQSWWNGSSWTNQALPGPAVAK